MRRRKRLASCPFRYLAPSLCHCGCSHPASQSHILSLSRILNSLPVPSGGGTMSPMSRLRALNQSNSTDSLWLIISNRLWQIYLFDWFWLILSLFSVSLCSVFHCILVGCSVVLFCILKSFVIFEFINKNCFEFIN